MDKTSILAGKNDIKYTDEYLDSVIEMAFDLVIL